MHIWLVPTIQALGKWRQENQKITVRFSSFIVNCRLAWATWDPMLKGGEEAREMAYWLKVFPILPKEQSSDPSTTCNSSSRGSDILFWLPHSDTMFHVSTTAGIKVCVRVSVCPFYIIIRSFEGRRYTWCCSGSISFVWVDFSQFQKISAVSQAAKGTVTFSLANDIKKVQCLNGTRFA